MTREKVLEGDFGHIAQFLGDDYQVKPVWCYRMKLDGSITATEYKSLWSPISPNWYVLRITRMKDKKKGAYVNSTKRFLGKEEIGKVKGTGSNYVVWMEKEDEDKAKHLIIAHVSKQMAEAQNKVEKMKEKLELIFKANTEAGESFMEDDPGAYRIAERLRNIADEMRWTGASSMTPHELLTFYALEVDKVASMAEGFKNDGA